MIFLLFLCIPEKHATCKLLRPSKADNVRVDSRLLSRTSISRDCRGLNVPEGMVFRLDMGGQLESLQK